MLGPDSGDSPIVDGFVYSASLLYLPTTFRASVYSQMEVLRRAKGYRSRDFLVPEDVIQPVPAYSQVEYQIQAQPGSYVWGLILTAPTVLNNVGEVREENFEQFLHVQITDNCTETPFFSDYVRGLNLTPVTGPGLRHPSLLTQPRIIGEPGTLNVEVYNNFSSQIFCQLAIMCAEPCVPPESMVEALRDVGLVA
jgi:hypothetical protein